MARKPLGGRRTAPTVTSAVADPIDITFAGGQTPKVVPPDSYDVEVVGARRINHTRSGAVSVELTLNRADTGSVIDLDTLLVHSHGGDSSYIRRNRGLLSDLAGIEDGTQLSFDELLERLNGGIQAEVELLVGTAYDGRPVNKLGAVLAIITEEGGAQ
jgi:hypothetical protein